MKKKILSLIMAVCLVTTCMLSMGISASAANFNYIMTSSEECKMGDTVDVVVYSGSVTEYACLVLSPEFNHDVMELVDVVSNIENGTFLYNEDPDNPKFIWYDIQNNQFDRDEVLFTMTFKVKERISIDTYPISLKYEEGNICDENGNIVEVEVSDGFIQTFCYIRGDVDGDLSITGADVVMLARYLVDLETEVGEGAYVNLDESIDGRDLIKLARYLVELDIIEDMYK